MKLVTTPKDKKYSILQFKLQLHRTCHLLYNIPKMKKFRPFDFILIITILAFGIFLTVKNLTQRGSIVKVNASGNHYEYSTKKDGIYEVKGLLGITTFEIKDGRVRIIDSPCPNKTCVNQGWHSPLVCLPNNVIITIEDEGEFDALSE